MNPLDRLTNRRDDNWRIVPLWSLYRRVSEPGYPDLPLLSVYREHGVVLREGRTDNHNRASEDLSAYQRVLPGDLVLNKMKTWQGSLGVSAYEGIVSPAYFVCRPTQSLDRRFMHHLLRSAPYVASYAALSKGIRPGQWDLPWERFRSLPVSLPKADEQRRIADFLDDQVALLDSVIQLRRQEHMLLSERRTVAVNDLLTGADLPRRTTGTPWFPLLPEQWSAAPLKYRWRVIDCKHRTPTYVDNGYPVVSTGDVSPGRLDLSGITRHVSEEDFLDLADDLRRPRRGDIVYSRNASIGTAAYVDTDLHFSMGQDVCRITSDAEDHLFLAHALNYLMGPQIDYEKVGSTFSRINVGKILNLIVPVPNSRHEERERGRAVDDVLNDYLLAEAAMKSSLDLLAQRKVALIAAAVTGDLDVTTTSSMA